MKLERLESMEQYILSHDQASMTELCEKFGISMNTARLDVAYLVNKGVVCKIYGGVKKKVTETENTISTVEDFFIRSQTNVLQKRMIGKTAASLIEDQDVLFVDSGSSTMFIMDFIPDELHVTVLTGSLSAVYYAASHPNISIFMLPGKYNRKTNSVSDISAAQYLSQFNFDKAFLAASAISEEGNLTVYSSSECNLKKIAIANSSQKILLADSSKFNKRSMLTYSTLEEMDTIITDPGIDENVLKQYGGKGIICELETAD